MSAADVAVIGGGIVGCSAAAFLAEAGAKVELVAGAKVPNADEATEPMVCLEANAPEWGKALSKRCARPARSRDCGRSCPDGTRVCFT